MCGLCVNMLEGTIYTVDEVSGLLDIPRPTLYRYLREYSIPHLRKAGRISIPEDSFDRIREARDLHREGLGTESVRRQLREDTGELDRRLDRGFTRPWRACGETSESALL
jgi:excisionase family DNA binding protein